MGSFKKEAARREREGRSADGMGNVRQKGVNFYRNAKKVKTLSMYKSGKARYNKDGQEVEPAAYQSKEQPAARVEPHRKWFSNSRVIDQKSLASFREAVKQSSDPYTYLLKSNKLPMSLIRDAPDGENVNGLKKHAAKMAVETNPFKDTFGPNARRKRVKLDVSGMEEMAQKGQQMENEYKEKRQEQAELCGGEGADEDAEMGATGEASVAREPIFSKGQSKRIWNELYKVLDASDVVIQLLDARDPLGTRCHHVEKYLKTEAPHKHLVFVLNKTDLIPTVAAATWVKQLSRERPTLAFHSSQKNPFGKGTLISLLRQFSSLHKHRAQLSVGIIGYPNTGKSSLINCLRGKRVCKTAPIPGETKVWQYVTLMKRIYLIDCPGVVPPSQSDADSDLLLRGVVRVENVDQPAQYVSHALGICERRHIERTYAVTHWDTAEEFLERLAEKSGRLLKGGEKDLDGVAKMFLNDFLRGKVPWFVKPEGFGGKKGGAGTRGEVRRLNQSVATGTRKRKRGEMEDDVEDDVEAEGDTVELEPKDSEDGNHAREERDEFTSLSSDKDAASDAQSPCDEAQTSVRDGGGVSLAV